MVPHPPPWSSAGKVPSPQWGPRLLSAPSMCLGASPNPVPQLAASALFCPCHARLGISLANEADRSMWCMPNGACHPGSGPQAKRCNATADIGRNTYLARGLRGDAGAWGGGADGRTKGVIAGGRLGTLAMVSSTWHRGAALPGGRARMVRNSFPPVTPMTGYHPRRRERLPSTSAHNG
jgi:hypothetical protein